MTVNPRAALILALAVLAVTGCNRKPAEGGQAAGDVLEGTVSDAMIATEQTRSEPPLAPRSGPVDGKAGKKQGKGGREGKAAAAPEPSASATPEASVGPAAAPATDEPAN